MNRPIRAAGAPLLLLLGACAATPAPTQLMASPPAGVGGLAAGTTLSAALGCAPLEEQIARAEQARRAAREKEDNAWKAVVPFAVAARYASGRAAQNDAQQTLDGLRAQAAQLGCGGHGG